MIIDVVVDDEEQEIEIPPQEYWIEKDRDRMIILWLAVDRVANLVKEQYSKVINDIEKEVYRYYGKNFAGGLPKYSNVKVTELIKKLKPSIDTVYNAQQKILNTHLIDMYTTNYLKSLYDIQSGTKVYSNFPKPTETDIEKVLKFPWSGINYRDRIEANNNKTISDLRQEITKGMIRGDDVKTISDNVASKLNVSSKNAQNMVQTESGAMFSESDKATYEEFGINEYEFVATLDARTTLICRELDGEVFPVSEMQAGENAPAMHTRCRSSTIPSFNDSVGDKIARNIKNGKSEYISGEITYNAWIVKYGDFF